MQVLAQVPLRSGRFVLEDGKIKLVTKSVHSRLVELFDLFALVYRLYTAARRQMTRTYGQKSRPLASLP
jgi:hypothetical protein